MKPTALTVAFLLATCSSAFAQIVTPQPSPPAPPAPVETMRPAQAPGPVLVDGKHVDTVTFTLQTSATVYASQTRVPSGTYFIASPGTLCNGAVKVTTTNPVPPNAPIVSGGPFTLTRIGPTTGCAISVSSSAGGEAATITF